MKVKLLAWILIALAASLTGLGFLINSWFYAVGGSVVTLYIVWRYAVFTSLRSGLQMTVTRVPDKKVGELGSFVSVEVTVVSNVTIRGTYTEVLSEHVALVEGQHSKTLSLAPGVDGTLRYTVQLTSRADFVVERVQFTPENDLFSETIDFIASQTILRQPPGALTIEQGSRFSDDGARIETMSVGSLYANREVGTDTDVAYLREYSHSDPAKRVAWKASARFAGLTLLVKELAPEFEGGFGEGTPISLVVDQTASMVRGPAGTTNLNLAVNLAGRLIKFGVHKGSSLSLVTYDEENVTDSILGDSPAHVTNIIDSLNSAEFKSQRKRDADLAVPSNWTPGITSAEVARFRTSYALTGDAVTDDDVRRFEEIVSYLYAHADGYVHELQRSPAFRAITATLERRPRRSMQIIFSDLETDLDPLIEGIRVAAGRGNAVHVVAFFPNNFETFEDALVNIADLYASYRKHRLRLNTIRQIKGVAVHEVTASDLLETKTLETLLTAL